MSFDMIDQYLNIVLVNNISILKQLSAFWVICSGMSNIMIGPKIGCPRSIFVPGFSQLAVDDWIIRNACLTLLVYKNTDETRSILCTKVIIISLMCIAFICYDANLLLTLIIEYYLVINFI